MADRVSNSILESVKDDLGLTPDNTVFDSQIIRRINSAFFRLNSLGVGPKFPYSIISSDDEWSSFSGQPIEAIKEYVYLKTRIVFDPPSSGSVTEAINNRISELEFLLNVYNDDGRG